MSDGKDAMRQERRKAPQPLRLPLPRVAVKRLGEAGVYCQPAVSLEFQSSTKRHVVRGVESGGAVREVGHYVLFCDEDGQAIPWLQPVQSIGANGLHAVVIAPVALPLAWANSTIVGPSDVFKSLQLMALL